MADVPCPRCGHPNPPGSNFCASCGNPLGRQQDDTATISFQVDAEAGRGESAADTALTAPEAGNEGMLVVTRGPNVGARIPLTQPLVTLGRHPESAIFLDDVTVSRRHAEISYTGGRYLIRDVGSLNGTYVNRSRVEQRWLDSDDELQIGKFKLVFVAPAEPGSR
ncbi:MAG: FHA domain-containing protein [Acidimicrobiia bacterium]|nr:FHA domain-containing protein [Acidimicrobiia bacterium]